MTEHVAPPFAHAADNGFPSDHTLLSMFLAACVFWYSRRWSVVLLGITVAIGATRVATRVATHVHHPIDIIAAMGLAIVAALVARPVAVRLTRPVPGRLVRDAG